MNGAGRPSGGNPRVRNAVVEVLFLTMVADGRIADGRTIMLLQRAAERYR